MTPPFPEVLVINLDHRTDRWAELEVCKAADMTPVRVPAVQMSPGWHGAGYSHLKCIRMAKERELPWVLILEDDATFTPEAIHRFRELLPYLWENRDKWERFNGGPTFPPDPVFRLLNKEMKLMYARGLCSHFNLLHSGSYDVILEWDPARDNVFDVYCYNLEIKFRTVFNNISTVPPHSDADSH